MGGGLNTYAYADGNSLSRYDPDGQFICAGVCMAIGGIAMLLSAYDAYQTITDECLSTSEKALTLAKDAAFALAGGAVVKIGYKAFRAAKTTGLIDDSANFAQKKFGETFSKDGNFSGQTINDIAAQLRRGDLTPADVPIEFFTRGSGQTLISNTRSAQALTRAGIPRELWHGVDIAGDANALRRLSGQLRKNNLPRTGTATVRPSGGGN